MIIVIDTNIVISSLINPKGKETDIILNPSYNFDKYTCNFLMEEIAKHKEKILKISKFNEVDFLEVYFGLLKKINFINEEQIPEEVWIKALEITKNVDENDTPFVALSLYLNAFLWTGDKKLIKGLVNKGFDKIISSDEVLMMSN
jgi:putative PIN family toxin of toxin-antitoxin system